MQKLLYAVALLLFVFSSCKKEEPEPPAPWVEEWFLFKATLVELGDTSQVAFSSNQGALCSPQSWVVESLWPWDDRCYYSSAVSGPCSVKLERGILFFESDSFGARPPDVDFVNFFRSGYYKLAKDVDTGFNIVYTDPDGWQYSTSEFFDTWNPNQYQYNFRIGDYHPFTRNGVQYVKVKIYFDDVLLYGGAGNNVLEMHDAEFEAYYKND